MRSIWKKWGVVLLTIVIIIGVLSSIALNEENSRPMFELLGKNVSINLEYIVSLEPNVDRFTVSVNYSQHDIHVSVDDNDHTYEKTFSGNSQVIVPFIVSGKDCISKASDWCFRKIRERYTLMEGGLDKKEVLSWRRYVEYYTGLYHSNKLIGYGDYDYDYQTGILLKMKSPYMDPVIAYVMGKTPDMGSYDWVVVRLISSSYPLGTINYSLAVLLILLITFPIWGGILLVWFIHDWRKGRYASKVD